MDSLELKVGLLGATSLVGECVQAKQVSEGWQVVAFSRQPHPVDKEGVQWRQLPHVVAIPETIENWICAAPIWVLPHYFGMLEKAGVRRIVAISSSSVLSKQSSSDLSEQALVLALQEGESRLRDWAATRGVTCTIFRPTLIYGLGRDKNISDIARFIRRFRFFPLLGKAMGRRQPIHAADVAFACGQVLTLRHKGGTYALSGGETLHYRDMIQRIFTAMGLRPIMLKIPLPLFRLAVAASHCLPRYKNLNMAMAERMNSDLVYSHDDATRDLGFKPRPFDLTKVDLP